MGDGNGSQDHGGDPPCHQHLLDSASSVPHPVLARLVVDLADAVVIANTAHRIVFWNAAATRVFGFDADEALGQSLDLIIPERLRGRHRAGFDRVMLTGTTSYGDRLLEVPAVHRDGRTLSIAFTVTLMRDPDSRRVLGVAAVIRDDTERWHETRQLRAEITRLNGPSAT